ncbi:MAG: hypothetical protein ACXADX_19885, partial [Candidatus Hodarchaeales archaeon]
FLASINGMPFAPHISLRKQEAPCFQWQHLNYLKLTNEEVIVLIEIMKSTAGREFHSGNRRFL